jgi:hypothetical protein
MTSETNNFALLDVETNEFVENESRKVETYQSGKQAAEVAQALSAATGRKYKPRKYVAPCYDWQAREARRFASGEYLPVLTALSFHCLPAHFAHVSRKDPSKIAYTKDAVDGAADVQKQISVRGYLETFAPNVSKEDREHLAKLHIEAFAGHELKFAKTPDEIEEVYTNYASGHAGLAASCMRYDKSQFAGHCHPVRVYGAGDLAIAYLENDEGETIARALCWPERKAYSRVYGSESTTNALHNLLQLHGYKKSNGYYGSNGQGVNLEGARLRRIENRHSSAFIAPYCDDIDYMTEHANGRYFVLGGRGHQYTLSETNGLTQEEDSCTCECCEDRVSEEDVYQVNVSYGVVYWCQDCRSDRAFYCHGTDEYYAESSFDCVEVNNHSYSLDYAQDHFTYCEHCQEWVDGETHLVNKAKYQETMCESCAQADAFRCIVDGELYDEALAAPDSLSEEEAEDGFKTGRYIGNLELETPADAPYFCTDPAQLSLAI